jgi:hypothetical protein
MKIQRTPDIQRFFERCMKHMQNDAKNGFLGMQVTVKNHSKIRRKMGKAGFREFQGPEETWPSLFISTADYLKSPYNANVKLDDIEEKEFRFTKERMPAGELFSVSAIHPDENRELDDWMTLRALDEPYETTFLWQANEAWMLDAPSEANTMDPYALKAHGKVVTFGLGIGYFSYMAMLNPNVQSITVVEKSLAVIAMFKKHILPQFSQTIPFTIIEEDAFDYFHESFLNDYDYVFVDIWKSNDDGLEIIERLLENYLPAYDKVDFWIESSCFETLTALIFLYFDAIAQHKPFKQTNAKYRRLAKKISNYFDEVDLEVNDVDTLKHYMYDPETLRKIAATQP